MKGAIKEGFSFEDLVVTLDGVEITGTVPDEVNYHVEPPMMESVIDMRRKIRTEDEMVGHMTIANQHTHSTYRIQPSSSINKPIPYEEYLEFIARLMNSKSIKRMLEEDKYDVCEYEV